MTRNVGTIDRIVRLAIAAMVLPFAFIGPATPWAFLGVIPLVTGLIGSCPLYSVLGFSSCPMRPTK
ncbi:MAG: DUF2892 domain-containing protein [Gemmatimonadaceae bacterium]|jgi:hypothetical protein|nr:DUF2892 domain-containing protein [Gemmatimonadaceae bacterium]